MHMLKKKCLYYSGQALKATENRNLENKQGTLVVMNIFEINMIITDSRGCYYCDECCVAFLTSVLQG